MSKKDNMDGLRKHLIELLGGGQAYDTFEDVVKSFEASERFMVPEGAEHSAWQIIDHMCRALDDILEFSMNEDGSYKEKNWPDEYWSKKAVGNWDETVNAYLASRLRMEKLVKDAKRDLFAVFPWGEGQTLLREALLAADHQAYHVGELVELQRWLNAGGKRERERED